MAEMTRQSSKRDGPVKKRGLRDGPLFFGGGGMKNPQKKLFAKAKRPNKLFADMKRKNKKFADWLMESYLI